jgi:hypothetical protein
MNLIYMHEDLSADTEALLSAVPLLLHLLSLSCILFGNAPPLQRKTLQSLVDLLEVVFEVGGRVRNDLFVFLENANGNNGLATAIMH